MEKDDYVLINKKHLDQIVKIDPLSITLKKCNTTFKKNLLANKKNTYYANHSNIEIIIDPAPKYFNKNKIFFIDKLK